MESKETKTIEEVCEMFGVEQIDDLNALYTEHDQKLMYANEWDYNDPELIPNRVRDALEQVAIEDIADEYDRFRSRNMLWLWYHHAISCAVWRYHDADAARAYATKALELQPPNHVNEITRLLYLLVHNREAEAREYAKTISTAVEQKAAKQCLTAYENGEFPK